MAVLANASPRRVAPANVLWRFFARRTVKSATFVSVIFGLVAAAKVIGYTKVYPTTSERVSAGLAMANQVTYKALIGMPQRITTLTGFAAWYVVGVGALLGGIWAYLIATKTFRGEETAGRWELLLSSETTMRGATIMALYGLGVSLLVYYVISALALIGVGTEQSVGYSAGAALYFACAATASAVMFTAVGALASQIMPTRARAAGLATVVFGVSFLLRAAGDISGNQWLVNVSPLGWVEQLRPLVNPQPLWLIPIVAFTLLLAAVTIGLAARRDLGASLLADRDTARPKYGLLATPVSAAVRLTGPASLAWLAGITALGAFFAALTNTAVQTITASATAGKLFGRLTGVSQGSSARTFLGVMYLLVILLLMAYAAYAVGSIRSDEADGFTDNLLVAPLSRARFLLGRISLAVVTILATSAVASCAAYLSLGSHTFGLTAHDFVLAMVNCLPAALFTLGVGICALGIAPRLATVIAYGVAVWSFLIQMLASGLHLNHWLLDTSVFTHISLTPAASPNAEANWILVVLGLILAIIGTLLFDRRDLAGE